MKKLTLAPPLMVAALVALAAVATGLEFSRGLEAQALVAPSYTPAQRTAGEAIYKQNCASCHGQALDDGEFAPPLRGVDFRASWFGQSADNLFVKIETMPPTAPGSLGAQGHADVMAYLLSQNALNPGQAPVPSDVNALREI